MASTLMSTADIASLLEAGLPDAQLEVYIDEADRQIQTEYGPHDGEVTERHEARYDMVFLNRQAASVREVKQYGFRELLSAVEPVDASTYELSGGGWVLRKPTEWDKEYVQVIYTPVSTAEIRRGVLVDLVKLALAYEARASVNVGGVSAQSLNRRRETNNIMARLKSTVSRV